MLPQNPSKQSTQELQNVSFYKVLSGNVSLGSPDTWDANNVGLTFARQNGEGNLFRIGATGSGLPLAWPGGNLTFQHNLGRLPTGFLVVYKDGPCDIYSAAAWTNTDVTLNTTNTTYSVIVYIF